jgi:hypothetical protein
VSPASRPEADRENSVGIMVVDHHPPFRRSARALINATSGFESVGDAEAIRLAYQLRPALVLMDVYLPDMDGFETVRRLTDADPDCVVVVPSSFLRSLFSYVNRASLFAGFENESLGGPGNDCRARCLGRGHLSLCSCGPAAWRSPCASGPLPGLRYAARCNCASKRCSAAIRASSGGWVENRLATVCLAFGGKM